MKPLHEWPLAARRAVRGVFCDIDDTLTTSGKLGADVLKAMERLHSAGKLLVAVTGRPAGWCDHIARMWPLDAVVGENGAFYFYYDAPRHRLRKRYLQDDTARAVNLGRLIAVRERILKEVPGAALASDQAYREADLAIDFCEDVARLSEAEVERIAAIMEAAGMTAKISSIHVNGWFGDYDKLGMTRILMRERYGIDLDERRGDYTFIGDSPNDAPLFGYFPESVGVANVRDFEDSPRLAARPAYVAQARCGAGFIELAECLLA